MLLVVFDELIFVLYGESLRHELVDEVLHIERCAQFWLVVDGSRFQTRILVCLLLLFLLAQIWFLLACQVWQQFLCLGHSVLLGLARNRFRQLHIVHLLALWLRVMIEQLLDLRVWQVEGLEVAYGNFELLIIDQSRVAFVCWLELANKCPEGLASTWQHYTPYLFQNFLDRWMIDLFFVLLLELRCSLYFLLACVVVIKLVGH